MNLSLIGYSAIEELSRDSTLCNSHHMQQSPDSVARNVFIYKKWILKNKFKTSFNTFTRIFLRGYVLKNIRKKSTLLIRVIFPTSIAEDFSKADIDEYDETVSSKN